MAQPAQQAAASSSPSPLTIGISGPSSSGKTTLARLLRAILTTSSTTTVFILHEDDFYKSDTDIPIQPGSGLADWDCFDALDLPRLTKAIEHAREHGAPPPGHVSQHGDDGSDDSNGDVSEAVVTSLREDVERRLASAKGTRGVVILEGFLLYTDAMASVRDQLDLRLFLPASYAATKRRREGREGYVTIEGFWTDPPGYVDQVVWPNYMRDHAFLFRGGDVEGELDGEACARLGIRMPPEAGRERLEENVRWAVGTVVDEMLK